MPDESKQFMRQMNRLCIEMTHTGRKAGAKKQRKNVLRSMKEILRRIGEQAHERIIGDAAGQQRETSS